MNTPRNPLLHTQEVCGSTPHAPTTDQQLTDSNSTEPDAGAPGFSENRNGFGMPLASTATVMRAAERIRDFVGVPTHPADTHQVAQIIAAETGLLELIRKAAAFDKLSCFTLNIRKPLLHGSGDLGWYSPPFDEEGAIEDWRPILMEFISRIDIADGRAAGAGTG